MRRCECGQPIHSSKALCSNCEQNKLMAEEYQRGREDILKEDAIRLEAKITRLRNTNYNITDY